MNVANFLFYTSVIEDRTCLGKELFYRWKVIRAIIGWT